MEPEPPRFHGKNPWLSGVQIFENPAETSISRSWPSESVSVDLACQRALLAAASEIRQNQKLGRGPRGRRGPVGAERRGTPGVGEGCGVRRFWCSENLEVT